MKRLRDELIEAHQGKPMKPANFAAVYACLYPELAEIARSHGYAMAVHGSLARDFDLVCVPWAEQVSDPVEVIDAITAKFAIQCVGTLTPMTHSRFAQTITVKFGECAIDLSFTPRIEDSREYTAIFMAEGKDDYHWLLNANSDAEALEKAKCLPIFKDGYTLRRIRAHTYRDVYIQTPKRIIGVDDDS